MTRNERVLTPEGPGRVVTIRPWRRWSHTRCRDYRGSVVIVELDDGTRRVFAPGQLQRCA